MSWSFSGVGKPAALADRARASLSNIKCREPEETIKGKVAEIVEECLAAFPAGSAVQIEASGSQSTADDGTALNSLSLNIKPLYGFVE